MLKEWGRPVGLGIRWMLLGGLIMMVYRDSSGWVSLGVGLALLQNESLNYFRRQHSKMITYIQKAIVNMNRPSWITTQFGVKGREQ